MKRIMLAVSAVSLSVVALAAPLKINMQQQENAAHVMSLLGQPLSKQEQCAKLGYIGYQNALSASYMSGIHGKNTMNPVKAYAWNLVAYHQMRQTKNKKMIKAQQKTMHFIAKRLQLTPMQKHDANKLANNIIKYDNKNWMPASEQMKMKDFPKPCNLRNN